MTFSNLDKKQKIVILSAGFIFVALIALLFLIRTPNKYGEGVSINNYDKYISNLPTDRRDSINSTLYKIIKSNSDSDSDSDSTASVKDATIRDGSSVDTYNKSTDINSGSFIVDMESIQQSYLISYEWSSTENNSNLSGYTAVATCLPTDKLIYGDFNCKDDFINSTSNTNRDPILKYLPQSTFNYNITGEINNDNKVDLNVEIFLYSADTRDGGRDSSIKKYKAEVIKWIRSVKLNPDNYTIYYSIEE
ncbi:MAG: hypothetical protein WA087_01245 [Candidatus Saccharimonadales bacterium]